MTTTKPRARARGATIKTAMNAKVTAEEVYAAIEGALSELYLESNEGVTVQKLLAWCEAVKALIYAHATAEKIARIINDADEEKQP